MTTISTIHKFPYTVAVLTAYAMHTDQDYVFTFGDRDDMILWIPSMMEYPHKFDTLKGERLEAIMSDFYKCAVNHDPDSASTKTLDVGVYNAIASIFPGSVK